MRRAFRLAYLLAQHKLHLHRELVRRGLALSWLDDFAAYWNQPHVKPVGLPITDYASFQAVRYHYAAKFRAENPEGDNFDNEDAQRARLLSYVWRREMHPLRWLPAAWHLRSCKTVLEYGAGAAPYAYGVTRAWPREQWVTVVDIPCPLLDYCDWQFRGTQYIDVHDVRYILDCGYEGVVCTEVFEHLPKPAETARWMKAYARIIVFDYVDDHSQAREDTLHVFRSPWEAHGSLSGPDARGLYVWRRTSA